MSCLFYASSSPSTFCDTTPSPTSSPNPNANAALSPGFAFDCPAVERDYMGIGLCFKDGVLNANAPAGNSSIAKNSEAIAHIPILADDLCGSHLKLGPPSSSVDDGGDGDADDGEPLSGNIGWPPISSYRKVTTRSLLTKPSCNNRDLIQLLVPQPPFIGDNTNDDYESSGNDASSGAMIEKKPRKPLHIKISMDGTPIMRKLDLESMQGYQHLSLELHKLFKFYKKNLSCEVGVHSSFTDSKDANFILTYKDTDGDWMLVGDTPWETFARTARRIRIMKKVK